MMQVAMEGTGAGMSRVARRRARPATMAAAVLEAPRRFVLRQVRLPEPGRGQVRVRLEGCGVCASNLPPWEGRDWFSYPMAPGKLGHEGWGVIDAVGPEVCGLLEGDRVAMLSDHAYAEYDVTDAGSVVPLPAELDGRPMPGEPLGCAVNIFARSAIEPGQTVAVIGIGFLGALLTRLCTDAGAQVIAISRRPFSLEVASQMGAARTLELTDKSAVIECVKTTAGDRLCERVIEATGKQEGLDLAGELCGERGRLIIAGFHQDGLRQVNLQLWNWRGLDVINAHERDPAVYTDGIGQAVRMVADDRLDPAPLYTHRLPLEQIGEALELTHDRPDGFVKALVEMGEVRE